MKISWLVKMAWRDSRRNRSRLFLFISSIIGGIAALVAIYSFGDHLSRDMDDQAKTLLGADLLIESDKPVSDEMQGLLDSLGDRRARERRFASMIYFPKSQGSRLVQVRALEGDYPFYGSIETTPSRAGTEFRTGQRALLDKTLMMQFNAQAGDSVQVGELKFEVAGAINKAPGQTGISSAVAPVVYIPLRYLEQAGLIKKGSRISYLFYYQYSSPAAGEEVAGEIEPRLEQEGLDHETVESQKEDTGRAFRDLTRFLSLTGFIALLLGCIGVASAVYIYIREKLDTIAVLRCLGVKASQAFLIYLIQILGIGLAGAVIGAALGTGIQFLLPAVLADFLPVEISIGVSWKAILQGILLGLGVSVLFALPPLLSVRKIAPLHALRISYEAGSLLRDRLTRWVYAVIILFIVLFAYLQMRDWEDTLIFTGGTLGAFGILALLARLLMWGVRRFFPASWGYVWRQGLANLYRPNNQTLLLIVAIGLGTTFISTLYFVQGILMNRITLTASGSQPNMVLFDIQTSQKEEVAALARRYNLPLIQQVPIVTTEIQEVNGQSATEVRQDSASEGSGRAFNRELRVTYRDTLTDSEQITSGKGLGKAVEPGEPVYVSLEENFARRIRVDIGDSLLFNVQGVPVPTIVGSFREVDWNRIQTNFRVIFPTGVLEEAPQFHVLITRVPSSELSARFQQAVVRAFPNVSIIDLNLILKILDELLDKIGFAIRFMAAFSIITGVVVLIASVLTSKYQRIQESVLLRTLGASRRQVRVITALEYFFLGTLAAAAGIILSLAGSWGLAVYRFETSFTPTFLPVAVLFTLVVLLTVIIGLSGSRGALNKPPLEILRRESI